MNKHLLVAFATLLTATAAAATAEAKGSHHHGHHHHHRHGRIFVYTAPVYAVSSCGYAYSKWQSTGSHYWKKQYYVCKGWW